MLIIGVDQSLSNRALYYYRCIVNTKKHINGLINLIINTSTRQFIESYMVSTL